MQNEPLATTEEWESRLGTDVRQLRIRQNLTQNELAGRANVSISSLKRLEAGMGSTTTTVIKVVRALGRVDWLADLAPQAPSISPIALLRASRQAASNTPRRVRRRASAGTDR